MSNGYTNATNTVYTPPASATRWSCDPNNPGKCISSTTGTYANKSVCEENCGGIPNQPQTTTPPVTTTPPPPSMNNPNYMATALGGDTGGATVDPNMPHPIPCTSSSQCPSGWNCSGGYCREPSTTRFTCVNNAACQAANNGEFLDYASCHAACGKTPIPPAGGCTSNADCQPNEICDPITHRCMGSGVKKYSCQNGTCVEDPYGTYTTPGCSGVCTPTPPPPATDCRTQGCPSGQKCNQNTGICEALGGLCAGVTCPEGQTCDPATGQCVGGGGDGCDGTIGCAKPVFPGQCAPPTVLVGDCCCPSGDNACQQDWDCTLAGWPIGTTCSQGKCSYLPSGVGAGQREDCVASGGEWISTNLLDPNAGYCKSAGGPQPGYDVCMTQCIATGRNTPEECRNWCQQQNQLPEWDQGTAEVPITQWNPITQQEEIVIPGTLATGEAPAGGVNTAITDALQKGTGWQFGGEAAQQGDIYDYLRQQEAKQLSGQATDTGYIDFLKSLTGGMGAPTTPTDVSTLQGLAQKQGGEAVDSTQNYLNTLRQQATASGAPLTPEQQNAFDTLAQITSNPAMASQTCIQQCMTNGSTQEICTATCQESIVGTLQNLQIEATNADIENSYRDTEADLIKQINDQATMQGMYYSGSRPQELASELRKLGETKMIAQNKAAADIRAKTFDQILAEREQRAGAAAQMGQLGLGVTGLEQKQQEMATAATVEGGKLNLDAYTTKQNAERNAAQAAVSAGTMTQETYNQLLQKQQTDISAAATWADATQGLSEIELKEKELNTGTALRRGQLSNETLGLQIQQQESYRQYAETWATTDLASKQQMLDFFMNDKTLEYEDALKRGELDIARFTAEVQEATGISNEEIKARSMDAELLGLFFDYSLNKAATEVEAEATRTKIDETLNQMNFNDQNIFWGILTQLGGLFSQ